MRMILKGPDHAILGDANVTFKARRYYGSLQGWKVFINGKKFPKERGHFYTLMDKWDCFRLAVLDILGHDKSEIQQFKTIDLMEA